MIVLDASAAVDLVLRGPEAASLIDRVLDPEEALHAPHLIDVEVAHVLRRFTLAGDLRPGRARQALDDYLAMPIERHPHDLLLPRAWALRSSLSTCDAMYVALAEALGAPLVTRDARLGRAHGHRARIELL